MQRVCRCALPIHDMAKRSGHSSAQRRLRERFSKSSSAHVVYARAAERAGMKGRVTWRQGGEKRPARHVAITVGDCEPNKFGLNNGIRADGAGGSPSRDPSAPFLRKRTPIGVEHLDL